VDPSTFPLAFSLDQSDESSCAEPAQKRTPTHDHDDLRNQHHRQSRRRRGTGRARRAGEGPLNEGRQPEEGHAQGQDSRKGSQAGGKTKTAVAKAAAHKKGASAGAKASKNATKPATKKAAAPRAQSKGAKILEMIARTKGATLAEIMKATDWQAHSVRGFISTAAKKHSIKIESSKSETGDRVYKAAK
jgi:Protein of unknown function (DUF3489)